MISDKTLEKSIDSGQAKIWGMLRVGNHKFFVTDGDKAEILMTLTSMGCPTAPLIDDRVRKAALLTDGIEKVEIEWTFDPPWDPEMITEEGRDILESLGYL